MNLLRLCLKRPSVHWRMTAKHQGLSVCSCRENILMDEILIESQISYTPFLNPVKGNAFDGEGITT